MNKVNAKKGSMALFIVVLVIFVVLTFPLITVGQIKLWITLAIVFLALSFVISVIASYNKFISLKQKVSQSESLIDVYLKQRFDLIPNIVETVKAYAKYEENILTKITELRAEYDNNKNENLTLSAELNNRYNQLLAVVENYPELKANEGFLNLQKQLSKIESQLQAARRIYNSDVTQYNIKVQSFPSNIIAGIFGFKEANLFEIEAHERENVDINVQ